MSVQGVENTTLAQVPNLQGGIVASRDEEAAVWVECDRVDSISVRIVVLDQPLRSYIPDFNRFI